jgi:hypothetical protein
MPIGKLMAAVFLACFAVSCSAASDGAGLSNGEEAEEETEAVGSGGY